MEDDQIIAAMENKNCPLCDGAIENTVEQGYTFKCTSCGALLKPEAPRGWSYVIPFREGMETGMEQQLAEKGKRVAFLEKAIRLQKTELMLFDKYDAEDQEKIDRLEDQVDKATDLVDALPEIIIDDAVLGIALELREVFPPRDPSAPRYQPRIIEVPRPADIIADQKAKAFDRIRALAPGGMRDLAKTSMLEDLEYIGKVIFVTEHWEGDNPDPIPEEFPVPVPVMEDWDRDLLSIVALNQLDDKKETDATLVPQGDEPIFNVILENALDRCADADRVKPSRFAGIYSDTQVEQVNGTSDTMDEEAMKRLTQHEIDSNEKDDDDGKE